MEPRLNSSAPKMSVIIPAYNQAHYLAEAVESVLAQTRNDYEIIVVDDGSTDETPAVAAQYGERIRYIRQENRGLAGARNTGIQAARGEYVGLLDSDDAWLPNYIEQILVLSTQQPDAAVLFCAARTMDATSSDLNQVMGFRKVDQDGIYQVMLRSNFIIPSTVTIRREALDREGQFDQTLPSGCEDWDLWLRLLPKYSFAGTADILVRYRIHGSSLSANTVQMQFSKRKVVEKHFGPDDGQYAQWSQDKRRAFGGYYRYEILTSVQWARNWQHADALRKACRIEPTLTRDISFFYELSLGDQPKGYRGTAQQLDLPGNARRLLDMLQEAFQAPLDEALAAAREQVYASAFKALGMVAYNTQQYALCRKYTLRAMRYDRRLLLDRLVVGNFLKSFLGKRGLSFLRGRRAPVGKVTP